MVLSVSENVAEKMPFYTIGHSSLSLATFIRLLNGAEITGVADVRSSPFSRRSPQYNRRELEASLKERGIEYRFFGKALGGRPKDPRLYVGGTADYEAMARTETFKEGVERVLKGSTKHRLALMCSELDPIECHRCLLVGRALSNLGVPVLHILADASVQSQRDIEERLLNLNREMNHDFFMPREEKLQFAYRDQGMRVAYTEKASWGEPKLEANDVHYG
jgi:uncharacterized protein (DUF488 family)